MSKRALAREDKYAESFNRCCRSTKFECGSDPAPGKNLLGAGDSGSYGKPTFKSQQE
jgi:hypothetical protein